MWDYKPYTVTFEKMEVISLPVVEIPYIYKHFKISDIVMFILNRIRKCYTLI